MKIFLDTADIEEIKEVDSWGILDGVTTNPTLVAKAGGEFKSTIREIAQIVEGPISAEAIESNREGIVREAKELAQIASNIVVKVPITEEGLAATKVLSGVGVKVNMTLVFSVNQAMLAVRVGASYVSPFVGRLDDIGHNGMGLVSDIIIAFENYQILATEVIAASIRHPLHVVEAAEIGADIVTVPYEVVKQMIKHPLTDIGVERFLKDWDKVRNPKKKG